MKSWPVGGTLLVFLGFGALTVLVTYPFVLEMGWALPSDLGDPLLNAWILAWDADRIRHGFQGLWDAPNFYPYLGTLTYSEHFLGVTPFSTPVQWLSGNPVLAYNVVFLFSYVLAGAGMYWLAASITGSRLAGLVAGVAFAFLPYRVAAVPHLHVLTFGWMPIGLLALHRYFDSGSRLALFSFVVVFLFQGLSSFHFLYFFTLPASVVVIAGLIRSTRHRVRQVLELVVASALILVVLAPVALAYYQTHREQGLVRSRSAIVHYSADVVSYGQVSSKLRFWGNRLEQGPAERELFPGLILATFAVGSLVIGFLPARMNSMKVTASHRSAIRVYGLIGLLAFIFSLGPEPKAFGQVLMSSGPYDWLLAVIPGLDGIRVVARFAVVVYLALSVLTAIGLAALLTRVSRIATVPLVLVLAAGVLGEGYPGPLRAASLETITDTDKHAAYEWLKISAPGAVLELPLGRQERLSDYYNIRYQFATLQHGHPVVNGFSGYQTPLFRYLNEPGSPVSDLDHMGYFLEGLRSLGVRYVVVNASLYGNRSDAIATIQAIQKQADQLITVMEFGTTTVFWLAGWDESPGTVRENLYQIPITGDQVTTSHRYDWWFQAVDGNQDTRWLTGDRQTGKEWIEVSFDKPQDVALVGLGIANRSLGDYPRELVVESVDPQGVVHTLYDGGVMAQLLRSLVKNGKMPPNKFWIPIDIALTPNKTQTLRIRQTSHTRTWYWSIHEFSLWSRPSM